MKKIATLLLNTTQNRQGYSLAEMLITMAVVSLVSAILMPKIVFSQNEQLGQYMRSRVDLGTQQFSVAIEAFKTRNDLDNTELLDALNRGTAANGTSYDNIFFFNGNFFALKGEGTGGVLHYFYFADRSRMSFNPDYFAQGNYTATSLPGDVLTACATGNVNNPSRCMFIDYNGAKGPNAVGPDGDIIPLLINTTNFSTQTVYAATADCDTVSVYDMMTSPGICP
jgi:prepilin-type N-terminal cleavage/methylation domain-containing protein